MSILIDYDGATAVTQSDSTPDPAGPFAALTATTAGTAKVITVRGQTVTIALALGIPFPLAVTQVFSTGSTASGIVGLYRLPYRGKPG